MLTNNYWKLVVLATTLSGASALIYEIVASRILAIFFGSALNSVTTVLIVFLGGLALGAAIMTSQQAKIRSKRLVFSSIQVIVAFYSILILSQFANLPSLFDTISTVVDNRILVQFISGFIFIIVPTILLGATFPLATTMIHSRTENNSRRVGWLYTWDVLGAVLGAAVAGFIFIPGFGNTATLILAASLNFGAAFIIFAKVKRQKIIYIILFVLFLVLSTYVYQNKSIFSVTIDANQAVLNYYGAENVLFQEESPYGAVRVINLGSGDRQDRILSIGGRDQCVLAGYGSESLIATGALAGLSDATVLSVGLGCGFTLASILDFNPSQVTVAEINPVVYEASQYFRDYTNDAINDKRVNINIIDGAEFIRTSQQKYDSIIIDIENPTVAHSSPLYTLEYFRLAKDRLNTNGRLAMWAYHSNDERYLKSLVTTFEAVFDNVVYADYISPPVYLLVASDGPLDASTIDAEGNYASLKRDLEAMEPVAPNTLDRPTLEDYYKLY